MSRTRLRRRCILPLAGLCFIALAPPAAAQFASVPEPPAPTPYAIRFGSDTAVTRTPMQQDSLRAAARSELRAWVDSAAREMGISLDLPDSLDVPRDSAALDSLARQTGPGAERADSVRRDSIRADSIRRDSIHRDSVRRTTPPGTEAASALPDGAPAGLGAAYALPFGEPVAALPHAASRRSRFHFRPAAGWPMTGRVRPAVQ